MKTTIMSQLNTFLFTSNHFNYHFLLQFLFQIRIFSFRQTGLQYPMPSIQRRLFYLYNKMLQVNEFLGKFENQKVIRFSFIQLDHELIFLYYTTSLLVNNSTLTDSTSRDKIINHTFLITRLRESNSCFVYTKNLLLCCKIFPLPD